MSKIKEYKFTVSENTGCGCVLIAFALMIAAPVLYKIIELIFKHI